MLFARVSLCGGVGKVYNRAKIHIDAHGADYSNPPVAGQCTHWSFRCCFHCTMFTFGESPPFFTLCGFCKEAWPSNEPGSAVDASRRIGTGCFLLYASLRVDLFLTLTVSQISTVCWTSFCWLLIVSAGPGSTGSPCTVRERWRER